MSLKKSALLLPTYASACTHYSITTQQSTTSCTRLSSPRTRPYATHHDLPPKQRGSGSNGRSAGSLDFDPHHWPIAEPPRTVPTPYEILQIDPKSRYSKTARFYQLVKIYHPDRHDHPQASAQSSIPKNIRLERYRLVVSAHTLLSDPEKRRAYDLYGAGWAGAKSLFPAPDFNMSAEAREACMHNATWQDWENWYDRFNPPKPGDPPRRPQQPLFLSNTAFISLVGVLAALAGVGQATRATESSKNYVLMVDAASNRAKEDVNQVQIDKQNLNREERIDYFLRTRDPEAYVEAKKLQIHPEAIRNDEPGREEDFSRSYR